MHTPHAPSKQSQSRSQIGSLSLAIFAGQLAENARGQHENGPYLGLALAILGLGAEKVARAHVEGGQCA